MIARLCLGALNTDRLVRYTGLLLDIGSNVITGVRLRLTGGSLSRGDSQASNLIVVVVDVMQEASQRVKTLVTNAT